MSYDQMNIGKKGYCVFPGHPVEHPLELNCWVQVRREIFNGTPYSEYVKLAKSKRDKGK